MSADREVWITGIGLLTSLGNGPERNFAVLSGSASASPEMCGSVAGYPVHRLCDVEFAEHIPSRSELRQMGQWQRIGVSAASLALKDAGLLGEYDTLQSVELAVAAGNGERDMALDAAILQGLRHVDTPGAYLNEALSRGLRPTLYLGELSNLLAGNIQIILKVAGSSRTFKGEEMAGLACVEDAWRRIVAGQAEIALVGGALNAEREDLLLGFELGCNLWPRQFAPVWHRRPNGGGFVPGSGGVFLVLEASAHARSRGVRPYAAIADVASDCSARKPGEAGAALSCLMDRVCADTSASRLIVLSGASGAEPATSEELEVLRAKEAIIRCYGTKLGHSVEAHLPLGIALGAMALSRGSFYPPFDDPDIEFPFHDVPRDVLVTSVGHWRGEGVVKLAGVVPGQSR